MFSVIPFALVGFGLTRPEPEEILDNAGFNRWYSKYAQSLQLTVIITLITYLLTLL